LIKNINLEVGVSELRELFSRYGVLEWVLVSPSGTLGIVEYRSAGRAKTALEKL